MDVTKIPVKFRHDIEAAKNLLKEEGCRSVYLFGSLVTGTAHERSDIDIGISGLSPEKFFKVYSKLDQALTSKVDLVDFDERKDFYNLLNRLGEVVEVG
jgi:predicted nucleotidyltransferase